MKNPELSLPRSTGSNKLSTLFLYFVLSPLLCAFSGFHLTSYLLVGLYTWPRTSRVLVLTIGTFIFVYEFIFKSQAPQFTSSKTLIPKGMGPLYLPYPICHWCRGPRRLGPIFRVKNCYSQIKFKILLVLTKKRANE